MKRNKFSLSNYKLFTADMGELIPIGWYEALPGDTIQMATNMLVRANALLAPVMHPVDVRVHHFFVPNRLLWKDWEPFITGGPDGLDSSEWPHLLLETVQGGSVLDYLGVPPGSYTGIDVSALPLRAYQLIFNEYYRDQDLENPVAISDNSGPDFSTDRSLNNVAWEKDYFTSSRPWEQKGPGVTIPLGERAPVSGTLVVSDGSTQGGVGATGAERTMNVLNQTIGDGPFSIPPGTLEADLSAASAITLNALRAGAALQRYQEARARFGSRYTEYLRSLGVISSDARLQRPEYLGGGRQTIQFSEVLATAEAGSTKVGDLKGHGITAVRSNRFRRFFEEHGIVMSLMSVRPKTMYNDGVHRSLRRRVKEDYYQKELVHLGQQAIEKCEVYAAAETPSETFGYQDRYDEYRRLPSTIAGEFRQTSLNYWHLGRQFASEPALNESFVKCVPSKRIFAEQGEDTLYCYAKNSIQARRLLPAVGDSFLR